MNVVERKPELLFDQHPNRVKSSLIPRESLAFRENSPNQRHPWVWTMDRHPAVGIHFYRLIYARSPGNERSELLFCKCQSSIVCSILRCVLFRYSSSVVVEVLLSSVLLLCTYTNTRTHLQRELFFLPMYVPYRIFVDRLANAYVYPRDEARASGGAQCESAFFIWTDDE